MPIIFSDLSDEDIEDEFPDLQELLSSLPIGPHVHAQPSKEGTDITTADKRNSLKLDPRHLAWTIDDSEDDSYLDPMVRTNNHVNTPETIVTRSVSLSRSSCEDESENQTRNEAARKVNTLSDTIGTKSKVECNILPSLDAPEHIAPIDCSSTEFGVSLQQVVLSSTPPSTPHVAGRPQSSICVNSTTHSSSVYFSCASIIVDSSESDDQSDNSMVQMPPRNTKSIGRRRPRIICRSDSESDSASDVDAERASGQQAIISYSPPSRTRPEVHKLLDTPSLKATKRTRIPRSPHRESSVMFWDEEESTAWNEQHNLSLVSSRLTPGKSLSILDSSGMDHPLTTPRRTKKDPALARRDKELKMFTACRESLAKTFLDDFLAKVCPELSSTLTGPIEIVWSKTLTSTAGRATYSKSKANAKIELSTKVIDSEIRLQSTLAHEMCHLMVWCVNGQFANPHGKEFKSFGRRVERLLGIEVGTTHNYDINYKYQWQCTNYECAKIYGRHSKSLDPTKVVCGACHTKLIQVLPKPRQLVTSRVLGETTVNSSPARSDGLSKYQTFLKANIARIKEDNPGLKYSEVIKIVAVEYAREKSRVNTLESDSRGDSTLDLTGQIAGLRL